MAEFAVAFRMCLKLYLTRAQASEALTPGPPPTPSRKTNAEKVSVRTVTNKRNKHVLIFCCRSKTGKGRKERGRESESEHFVQREHAREYTRTHIYALTPAKWK